MPTLDNVPQPEPETGAESGPQFPPVTRDHILHCSYDYWFPKYRSSCIQSRLIPLPPEFVEYIREDGIILADDDGEAGADDDDDDWVPQSESFAGARPQQPPGPDSEDSEDEEEAPPRLPPNQRFPALHQLIKDKIAELGGEVAPKLNWSAPKDAAWISMHQNTMKCTAPNDIYLLLKSSSFVSHDLEHAFDDCVDNGASGTRNSSAPAAATPATPYKPVLVLRSFFSLQPALEFRCFAKHRNLVAITQRDMNYYHFLARMEPAIVSRVRELFNSKLRFTFPEGSFVFDVYMPENHAADDDDDDDDDGETGAKKLGRARLIDINPWAPRTDTILFDWGELLTLKIPGPILGTAGGSGESGPDGERGQDVDTTTDDDEGEEDFVPEVRFVHKDDPAASNFISPQYSAHKLPKEVVDASASGEGGLREFAEQWRQLVEGRIAR